MHTVDTTARVSQLADFLLEFVEVLQQIEHGIAAGSSGINCRYSLALVA